ncbi:hypothetical protein DPEC_G00261570 [Dallia pectoralis]|uniref:Uncharacterized protein n=1 Tax=Dallia pectoralis TaxID=75939 RepID=A0ACC2FRL3_DALPE|nr:hypothetical protein DPEC_G00261570 [Dallia pectoralis]
MDLPPTRKSLSNYYTVNCRTSNGGQEEADHFPTLTLVNVSEWAVQNIHQGKLLQTLTNRKVATNASPVTRSCWSKARQRDALSVKREDLPFPGFNCVYQSPSNKQHKEVKLNTAQINPFDTCSRTSQGSNLLVMWIPNPHHIHQCRPQKRAKSPHLSVKEIILFPSSKTSNMRTNNSKNMEMRVRFQLTPLSHVRCEQTVEPSVCAPAKSDPDVDPLVEEKSGNLQNQELLSLESGQVAQTQTETRPRPGSTPSLPFLLNSKPVVFHSARERTQRHNHQVISTFKYKLDSKMEQENVDWNSMRRQTYLWRKQNPPPKCDRERPSCPETMTTTKSCQKWDGFGFYPTPKIPFSYNPRSRPSIGLLSPERTGRGPEDTDYRASGLEPAPPPSSVTSDTDGDS